MKLKTLLLCTSLAAGIAPSMAAPAEDAALFTPVQETELRLPAVPLLMSDPFFSIWSAYNNLQEGTTTHWRGDEAPKPLVGAARVDGVTYRFMGAEEECFEKAATQQSVDVLPTQTYYTFLCGPVEVKVVFTAPLLMDDLDLLSTPINYISYQARSLDKKAHDVQIYIETSPWMAVDDIKQPTISKAFRKNGLAYLQSGTINQPYLEKKGDFVCIDWGYVYLAGKTHTQTSLCLGDRKSVKQAFAHEGKLPVSRTEIINRDTLAAPALAYCEDLGLVDKTGNNGFVMIGYDDIYCIEYMYQRRQAYWKHEGEVSIFDAFERACASYEDVMRRCREWDKMIWEDAEKAGGREYAEILAATYRQAVAAHKLFKDEKGNILFFSKENASNGSINTVDVSYPSIPLFLLYNPELVKGMTTSIFDYSASGRWSQPFPAHDLGRYPVANEDLHGAGGMPVEESGNMLIMAAAIAQAEGNAQYAARYWPQLTGWADYLVEHGQDPADQLCTDDFAGHWAHNVNLSAKAIVGIAAYSRLAHMLGMDDTAERYQQKAREMARKWEQTADDGDHYRLAFDRPGTWSQKYNMVWDKLWGLGLFSQETVQKEIAYYLSKQNRYGLPLDSRKEYTKSDWIMWTASMAPDQETMLRFISPVYDYINETPTRWPIGDWHETVEGTAINFRARSVVGGYWMPVLMQKMQGLVPWE